MGGVRSFRPVAGPGARVLVLGSMPGRASLEAGEYYAHPRNQFWPIVTELLGGSASMAYPERLRLLKRGRVALWDVLAYCVRPGSADSAIERGTMRPNAVAAFLAARPGIEHVFFNGSKAEECFRRFVAPSLPSSLRGLELRRLPSTSPAHASMTRACKLRAWGRALAAAGVGRGR